MPNAELLDVNEPVDIGSTAVQNHVDIADGEGSTLSTSAAEITGTRITSHPGGDLLIFGSIDFRCAKATTVGDIYEGGISINGSQVATLHESTRSLSDDPTSPAHNSGQAQGMAIAQSVTPNTPIYLTARNATGARGRWGTETTLQIMQLGNGADGFVDMVSGALIAPRFLDRIPLDDNGRQPFQASAAQLTLSGSYQRPSGCYYDTPRAGSWLAIGTFDFAVAATSDAYAAGYIGVDGSPITSLAAVSRANRGSANQSNFSSARTSVMAFALTGSLAADTRIELLATMAKTTGADPTCEAGHTKLAVVQVA